MNTSNATATVAHTATTAVTKEFFEAQDKQLADLQASYENSPFIGNIESGSNASAKRLKSIITARDQIKISLVQIGRNEPVTARYGYCKRCGQFLGMELLSKVPLAIEHGRECPKLG
jgi:RNA polymerase-binding transcription factor DksA